MVTSCADNVVTESSLISIACRSSAIIVSFAQKELMVVPHCRVGRWKHGGPQTLTSLFVPIYFSMGFVTTEAKRAEVKQCMIRRKVPEPLHFI